MCQKHITIGLLIVSLYAHCIELPNQMPQDMKDLVIIEFGLKNVHKYTSTIGDARNFIMSISLINKTCNEVANNPYIVKDIIHNLAKTLRWADANLYFEEELARFLNTVASKKYISLNELLFCKGITKDKIQKI